MKRFWQAQWAYPVGLWGHIAGCFMQKNNYSLNMRVFEALILDGIHSILEIGCGPGVLLQKMLAETKHSYVVGVDPSPVMIKQATRRNKEAVNKGIVLLETAVAHDLPFQSMGFDRIVTVDTYPYFEDIQAVFTDIHRVLQPGGQFILGVRVQTNEGDTVLQGIRSNLHAAQLKYVGAERFSQRRFTEIIVKSTR